MTQATVFDGLEALGSTAATGVQSVGGSVGGAFGSLVDGATQPAQDYTLKLAIIAAIAVIAVVVLQ